MRSIRIDEVIRGLRGEPKKFPEELDPATGKFSSERTVGSMAVLLIENSMNKKEASLRLAEAGRTIVKALDAGESLAELENAEYSSLQKMVSEAQISNAVRWAFEAAFEESEKAYKKVKDKDKEK